MTSLELTVGGVNPKDAGKGIARIDQEAMRELSLVSGDVVRITGERETVVKVWPGYSQDSGRGVIRIDGEVRKSAGVGIDDHVQVERVETEKATEVKVSLPQNLQIRGNLGAYLKDQLSGRPITKGQVVAVSMGLGGIKKNKIPLKIADTEPSDVVVVGNQTDVTVSEKPAEQVSAEEEEDRETPDVTYEDIGGLREELEQVREMIELPMRHPELFEQLGIEPPKGVLLYGPPGTGKTLIAKAVANEIDAHFETISGPEIMSKYYGESEEQLREVFDEAEGNAPAVIFIDELDSIAPARDEVSGEVERRVVAQLLSLMDGLEGRGDVVVIAATNRVDAVDTALRRGGRFDREIEIGVPSREGRDEIFQIHTRGMPLSEDVDIDGLAEETYGFVGADIEALTKEAAMSALRRIRHDIDVEQEEIPAEVLEALEVDAEDFDEAMKTVEPSAMREVFVEVPDITYDDVGGLEDVKQALVEAVEWPLEHGDVYSQVGAEAPKGILLFGPPGTGKTLLAKAVANASNSNFISVKGPELLNKYVGESEKGVREVFQKARQNAPTVIFFDELDSIAPERGGSMDTQVTERVVSQLLTELDGVEELKDVRVIAATNRPDMIDTALLRPGRLDKSIEVPLPDYEARKKIFEIHTQDAPLADEIDFNQLSEMAEGYTGSDIEAVCREATMSSVRELLTSEVDEDEIQKGLENVVVTMEDFEEAFEEVGKSLDEDDVERYRQMAEKLGKETSEEETNGDKTFR